LGGGRLLIEGNIQQLKQVHNQRFEVRLKGENVIFAQRLCALGCSTETRDDVLLVQIPQDRSPQLYPETAIVYGVGSLA
jgi:hypothetical protein